jgi:hypothetical protein
MSEITTKAATDVSESIAETTPDDTTPTEKKTERFLDERMSLGPLESRVTMCERKSQQSEVLDQKLKFCGVVKSVGDWANRANLRTGTVYHRIKRGLPPIDALTTSDREGNRLQVLSDDEVRTEIKQVWRNRSTTGTITTRDKEVSYAVIVADHRMLFLGSYLTYEEADLAFNTAVGLLPQEWEEGDMLTVEDELDERLRLQIEERVHERIKQHLQNRVEGDLTVFDFPDHLSISCRELFAPVLTT